MKLTITPKILLVLLSLVGTNDAFGPVTPLNTGKSVVKNNNAMTMRVSLADLKRKQTFNKILKTNAPKEVIESKLVTEKASQIVRDMNWKPRKVYLRKIRKEAVRVGIDLPEDFGVVPSQTEREAAEKIEGAANKIVWLALLKTNLEEKEKMDTGNRERKAAKKAKFAARLADAKAKKGEALAAKVEEPKVEEAKVEESKAEEPKTEEAAKPATAVTVTLIKELRMLTGAGMMDCKKALTESEGDVEQAIENMRTSGALKAGKKAAKVAAEGQIIIKSNESNTALVEVNCQTDFVAKDSTFLKFANEAAQAAADGKLSIEDLKAQFEEKRVALVATIGENIVVRRVQYIEGIEKATYLHNGGKIGVVICGEGEESTLKNMCMHVCASNPKFMSPDEVPDEVVEKEKKVQIDIAMNEGKPAEIAEKMVTGRMKKYTGEISLFGQPFVMEPKKSVADILKEKSTTISGFIRLEVGEGIEVEDGPSFADEVASMAAGS